MLQSQRALELSRVSQNPSSSSFSHPGALQGTKLSPSCHPHPTAPDPQGTQHCDKTEHEIWPHHTSQDFSRHFSSSPCWDKPSLCSLGSPIPKFPSLQPHHPKNQSLPPVLPSPPPLAEPDHGHGTLHHLIPTHKWFFPSPPQQLQAGLIHRSFTGLQILQKYPGKSHHP